MTGRLVMTPGRCANGALALLVVGWLLLLYGTLSQMGDPSPEVSREVFEASRHRSLSILLAGLGLLMGALWLSGRSFDGAPWRSAIVGLGVSLPMLVVLFAGLW